MTVLHFLGALALIALAAALLINAPRRRDAGGPPMRNIPAGGPLLMDGDLVLAQGYPGEPMPLYSGVECSAIRAERMRMRRILTPAEADAAASRAVVAGYQPRPVAGSVLPPPRKP